MKRRMQRDDTGCGIACIAMLADCSYQQVRQFAVELGIQNDGEFYTSTGDLRQLAEHFGVVISAKRRRTWKDWVHLPDTAIVAINPKDDGRYWHWVVFVRRDCEAYVLDPKRSIKSKRRTDWNRMKPIGFFPVDCCVTKPIVQAEWAAHL